MKIESILYIYDALLGGQKIDRNTFCAQFKISERTFYRYMREINAFIRKHKPEYIVDVKEPAGGYFIKKFEF